MPKCTSCDASFPMKRAELGYNTCTTCGEAEAARYRAGWCIAPIAHKQGYTRITSREQLSQLTKSRPT